MKNSMYQQNIIDHYRNPRNKGELENADITAQDINPTCGDSAVLQLKLQGDKIADVRFMGSGCAISQAAISMLTEKMKGMPIQDARKIDQDYILKLLGVPVSHSRLNCAFLALKALRLCVYSEKANKIAGQ